jgi:hypothetical protein
MRPAKSWLFAKPAAKAKSATCVVLSVGGNGARLVNTCGVCEVAEFNDFNGGVEMFKIPAYGYKDLPPVSGQLVGDHPCP